MSTTFRERPILFSAPMVQAILKGHKTQTRRVMKPQPLVDNDRVSWSPKHAKANSVGLIEPLALWRLGMPIQETGAANIGALCPYGQPGDRLWVRETWCLYPMAGNDGAAGLCYRATNSSVPPGSWKPSIHMPRWASRITLQIASVRVEQLNDISEADAMAEGCQVNIPDGSPTAVAWFHSLWESINGHDSWAANPWVWVLEFRKIIS